MYKILIFLLLITYSLDLHAQTREENLRGDLNVTRISTILCDKIQINKSNIIHRPRIYINITATNDHNKYPVHILNQMIKQHFPSLKITQVTDPSEADILIHGKIKFIEQKIYNMAEVPDDISTILKHQITCTSNIFSENNSILSPNPIFINPENNNFDKYYTYNAVLDLTIDNKKDKTTQNTSMSIITARMNYAEESAYEKISKKITSIIVSAIES